MSDQQPVAFSTLQTLVTFEQNAKSRQGRRFLQAHCIILKLSSQLDDLVLAPIAGAVLSITLLQQPSGALTEFGHVVVVGGKIYCPIDSGNRSSGNLG